MTPAGAKASATARELLAGLNAPQREAVTAPDGPLLILAGAGSGKTRVLTHRIAYLLATGRVAADEVLAVTFTNKAAREMRLRVANLLGGEPAGLWLGTFHAVAARILRRDGPAVGVPQGFTIFDEADRQALLRAALREIGADDRRTSPGATGAAISAAKNELQTPEAYARAACTPFEHRVARVWPSYQAALQASGGLDFDDLLLELVRLLTTQPAVAARYQARFGHILVDEYQDTNRAQYLAVRTLAERHRRLTVVGDPDQSVYGWRGADLRNILNFEADYPEARVIALEQNYRSTGAILAAAQAVIRENVERVEKRLWTAAEGGTPVVMAQLYDEREEAQAVAAEAQRLVQAEGCALAEMAVLYRTNAQSRALEEVFLRQGLPYQLVGGVRFYERREVKDVLAYLRLLLNPDDAVAFERVVNVPRRGVGSTSLEQLRLVAARHRVSPYRAIPLVQGAEIRGAAATGLLHFHRTMEELRQWAQSWPLPTVLDRLLEVSGYRALVRDGSPEGDERWANVVELRGLADEHGQAPVSEALPAFLEQAALSGDQDTPREAPSGITLITLHQVKGLEFPVVFITGLEEGLLPHSRSLDTIQATEEERRLLYVGMTRAMRRLYLFHAFRRHLYGAPSLATPSRFLGALPRDVARLATSMGGGATTAGSPAGARLHARAVPMGPGPGGLVGTRAALDRRATSAGPAVAAAQMYERGTRVEHPKYGRGMILKSTMTRAGEEVVIQFDTAGPKIFAVADAVLRPVPD